MISGEREGGVGKKGGEDGSQERMGVMACGVVIGRGSNTFLMRPTFCSAFQILTNEV